MIKDLSNLVVTAVASGLLIVMGLVYFIITLWIVKIGSGILGYTPDGNWAVFAASLISVGTMIGSAIQK
ncbi:MAG: hypothetical protein KJ601_00480 [Nanoarchaeota archaeon]|nr:hypothetical protein [Nanoarchaeota archaeon]MBU1704549.1 hypothetical protein [Nanoarchaeota archaeon]